MPRLIAATLRERGVPDEAILLIPDEQEAIDAALRMGQPGDLLLVFADALVRSWKQITKFKPDVTSSSSPAAEMAGGAEEGVAAAEPSLHPSHVPAPSLAVEGAALSLEGLIRDERGVRFAPESDD